MTNNFLYKTSKNLFSKYKEELAHMVVVLPSRRSSLFLTKELSTLISRPIWLPTFYSIDDFFFGVNNLKKANSLELFFAFYNSYKKNIINGHDIERSYKWAHILLEDFNEVDKASVNHNDLFEYLSDLKRIESWYLDIGSHKEDFQQYVQFFNKLSIIYQDFIDTLISKKMAYAGLAQRLTVDDPTVIQSWLKNHNKKRIVFIGLDALTISQEKVINYLLKNDLCDVFWDADRYFVDDEKQESGQFLRKYKKKWPAIINNISDDFLTQKKEISIIGATKNINQVKLLAHLLNTKSYSPDALQKTAIILPNENLLLSVLESIPKEIKDINVTMGYNLSLSPIVSIFDDFIKLYINKRRINVKDRTKSGHYFKSDIIKLLHNPYMKLLLDSFEKDLDQKLISAFQKTGFNYISYEDIRDINSINKHIFLKNIFLGLHETGQELSDFFKLLISKLLELLEEDENDLAIDHECLFTIEDQVLSCSMLLEEIEENISIKLFAKLFQKVLKGVKLNFSGEPLKGIQIMGLLESRTIDFDEVFILSANESELPPQANYNSFIPFDVKLRFNIRTDLDIDAMYANMFFNLIKRPTHTYIIYNQDVTSFSSGERSRYINQLLYEIKPIKNTSIAINHQNSTDSFSLANSNSILQTKDEFVFAQLKKIAKNGFSPSTINLYSYCKRQFYFEKVLGVTKKENSINNIDNAMMGSIIHRVLHKLYAPYIDTVLDKFIMNSIQKLIDRELMQTLQEYKIEVLDKGKNLLAIKAINRIVVNFVEHEANLISLGNHITIKFLEHEVSPQKISVSKLEKIDIYLKGNIDRIDMYNNNYRIIDYKTGLIYDADLKAATIREISSKPKVFQLLCYAWLFNKQQKQNNRKLLTGVINLRAQNFDFQNCRVNTKSYVDSTILADFEKSVEFILHEMFDPDQGFDHLERDEECWFCD